MRLSCLFLLTLTILAPVADASEARRLAFVEALGKIESGQGEAEDYPALRDYVLYPYLESAELHRNLRKTSGDYLDKRIDDFLARHGEAPFTRSLRLAWLRQLAKRQKWQTFLNHYPKRAGEELDCLAAQAKIGLDHGDAKVLVESLWLTGSLRHKTCIPVFDWLEKSGGLSQALIDARVRLAMAEGNLKLVQSLASKQAASNRKRTDHWLWAWRNPRDAIARLSASGDSAMDSEMIDQVFRRLAVKDRRKAADLYEGTMQRGRLDESQKQALAAFIGFRFILNREPEALTWYRRSGSVELRDIESDWRIRSAIYAQSWKDVLFWIAALPADRQNEPRWLYWKGRASLAEGNVDAGRAAYTAVAQKRDFYGFLAADYLGRPYTIVDLAVQKVAARQQALESRPDVQRAHELWKAGLRDRARSEWSALLDNLDKAEQLQAGILADEWGWWPMAITSYGKAGYWDDLSRRFPAPYRSLYEKETGRQGVPRSWAYAITRSESMFAHDARSPVGALGLMQLMPATAKAVARSEGLRWQGTAMLFEENRNVRLGVRYLADLRKKYDGHIALATAAYNAGPGNVNRWLPERDLPADIWIEAVPFAETHNYLRHVLEFMATYEWRLSGKAPRLTDHLPPVEAR